MAQRPLPFTAAELRASQLFGIPMRVRDEFGVTHTYSDEVIEQRIRAAVNAFERRLKLDLWARKVVTRADILLPGGVQGVDYDIDEDPYDYEAPLYYANGFFQLRRRPVISVEQISLRFPEDQNLFNYPENWIRLNRKGGQVNIIAIAGASSPVIIGREGGYLPLLTGQLLRSSYPQLLHAIYTTGLDWQAARNEGEYEDLFLALQQQSALYVLMDLGRGTKPGISSQSLSEDGQSQSVSYARQKGGFYGNEIAQLNEDVEKFLKSFKQATKGPLFTVL